MDKPPFQVGSHTVNNPELLLTSYTTWNDARLPGSTKTRELGAVLRELHYNDLRTGCSPIAPYFAQLAQMKAGDKLSIQNPNGYVHHYECE